MLFISLRHSFLEDGISSLFLIFTMILSTFHEADAPISRNVLHDIRYSYIYRAIVHESIVFPATFSFSVLSFMMNPFHFSASTFRRPAWSPRFQYKRLSYLQSCLHRYQSNYPLVSILALRKGMLNRKGDSFLPPSGSLEIYGF